MEDLRAFVKRPAQLVVERHQKPVAGTELFEALLQRVKAGAGSDPVGLPLDRIRYGVGQLIADDQPTVTFLAGEPARTSQRATAFAQFRNEVPISNDSRFFQSVRLVS